MKIPRYMNERVWGVVYHPAAILECAVALEIDAAANRKDGFTAEAHALRQAAKSLRAVATGEVTWAEAFHWPTAK